MQSASQSYHKTPPSCRHTLRECLSQDRYCEPLNWIPSGGTEYQPTATWGRRLTTLSPCANGFQPLCPHPSDKHPVGPGLRGHPIQSLPQPPAHLSFLQVVAVFRSVIYTHFHQKYPSNSEQSVSKEEAEGKDQEGGKGHQGMS